MHQISRLILQITPKFSTIHQIHTNSSHPKNQIIYNYLINTFNFPKSKALTYSNIFAKAQTLQKPQSVINYFKSIGFTNTQIINSANLQPQMLFSNIDKTLKPKIQFFEELGLSGTNLCKFISKNSTLLRHSLNKKLKPNIETIRNILVKHDVKDVNASLFRVISNNRILGTDHKRMLGNVEYLERSGVFGSRLGEVLMISPMLLSCSESDLRRRISIALDLGFSVDSRMLMHGLNAICSISNETFGKKWELFESFGFTEIEFREMVKRSPRVLRVSLEKLRFGVGFYLETVGLEKSALIRNAFCLSLDMKNRVVPRYAVVRLMKSKGILKEERQFTCLVKMSEVEFLEKYITRFSDHAEDLWYAYTGHLVDSSGLNQQISK